MKVVIDIPREFISHWKKDKFKDSLERVSADIAQYRLDHRYTLSGIYEEETISMLIEAFCNSEKTESKKQMCTRAYNKGYEDGVEYAEKNPPLRPNY